MVGADLVVAGTVGKYADEFVVRLKLFDTRTAALLGQGSAGGRDLQGVRLDLGRRAGDLFRAGVLKPGAKGVRPPPKDGGPPADVESVTEVRPDIGLLRVEGSPRDARVDVTGPPGFGSDGRLATVLPYGPAEVPAGRYQVRVSSPGYEPAEREVFVPADRTQAVAFELLASKGTLVVTGTPTGARVEMSCSGGFNKVFGLPSTLAVPRGGCTVSVTRTGYEPFSRTVEVAGGKTATVEVRLVEVVVPGAVAAPELAGSGPRTARREPPGRAVRVPVWLSVSEGFVWWDGSAQRTHVGTEAGVGLRFEAAPWLRPEFSIAWTYESPVMSTVRAGVRGYAGPVYARTLVTFMVAPGRTFGFVGGLGGDIPLGEDWFVGLEADATVWSRKVVPVDFRVGVGHAF
jgi:hypothetical protein